MSEYNESADRADNQLKKISKTMCYAKWTQSSMHLTNGMTHSCYHPPLHKISIPEIEKNPSALHNTAEKKAERSLMLKGERPVGCSYCWNIEDSGNRSDRIYRSGEYWAQNSRNDIIDALDTGNINPRYLEVNFNQACNLKCMYCSPHLSTEWEDEVRRLGEFKIFDKNENEVGHNNLDALAAIGLMPLKTKQAENPYVSAFWQWWPELYKKLEVFRITGGEPLMDANTFKVLDYIYKNPNTWLELSITSNFSPPKHELMDKFIDKVKKLEEIQIWEDKERFNPGANNHWYVNMALKNLALFVSVDSVGNQAEYIRTGLNYSYMQENVIRFLNETKNTTVTFINTFNALSFPKFKDYLQYILDLRKEFSRDKQGIQYIPIHDPYHTHPDYEIHPRQRIWFDIPLLRNPAWQNMNVLPVEFASYLEQGISFMKENTNVSNFVGFYDFEISKAERNLAIFKDRTKITDIEANINRKNFVKYFSQHDARRGTNFFNTFPEFKNVF